MSTIMRETQIPSVKISIKVELTSVCSCFAKWVTDISKLVRLRYEVNYAEHTCNPGERPVMTVIVVKLFVW